MTKRNGQIQMEGTETDLSRACDAYIEAKDGLNSAREALHSAEADLLAMMRKSSKKSIKHAGNIIRWVHQEEKDKIQAVSE